MLTTTLLLLSGHLAPLPPLESPAVGSKVEWTSQIDKALELAREQGTLRGSLDAAVILYAEPVLAERLRSLGEELRFVLITSEASVEDWEQAPNDAMEAEGVPLKVVAVASTSEKCERCWHRRDDVGAHAAHPTLCGRCVTNIDGQGEVRQFA